MQYLLATTVIIFALFSLYALFKGNELKRKLRKRKYKVLDALKSNEYRNLNMK